MHLVPNSFGAPLREYNPCHNKAGNAGGQFCSGSKTAGAPLSLDQTIKRDIKARVRAVSDYSLQKATYLIANGKSVPGELIAGLSADGRAAVSQALAQRKDRNQAPADVEGPATVTNTAATKKPEVKGEITRVSDGGADSGVVDNVFAGRTAKQVAERIVRDLPGRYTVSVETEGSSDQGRKDRAAEDWDSEYGDQARKVAERWQEIRKVLADASTNHSQTGELFGTPPARPLSEQDIADLVSAIGLDKVTYDLRAMNTGREREIHAYEEPLSETQIAKLKAFAEERLGTSVYTERYDRAENPLLPLLDIPKQSEHIKNYEDDGDNNGGEQSVVLKIVGQDHQFNLTRTFTKDEYGALNVDHDYLRVGDTMPLDTGKKVFEGLVDEYERMGVDTINLHANIDVGGYAWGRYGFVPNDSLAHTMRRRMEDVEVGGTMSYVEKTEARQPDGSIRRTRKTISTEATPELVKTIHSLISDYEDSESASSWWKVVDAKADGTHFSIGKFLLLNSDWYATFEMSDRAALRRMKAYIAKGKT